jgi:hypothetical protein
VLRILAASLAVLAVPSLAACGSGGDDAVRSADPTTTPSSSETPSGPTTATGPADPTRLPVGEADSPYWVAHVLPDGHELMAAEMRQDPDLGPNPAPMTGYGPAGRSRDDADLWITAMEWDAPADFWDGARTEAEMDDSFRQVTIRGRQGMQYPLRGDGRDYGTVLVWEERPGLWIQIEAAEPLTEADAYAVADGLQPFPEDQWDALVTGLDQTWHVEPGALEVATVRPAGETEDGDRTLRLDALEPEGWHDVPVERRLPCVRLTIGDASLAEAACDGTRWYVVGGRVYLVGVVGALLDGATVELSASGRTIDALVYPDPAGHDVTYWAAALGDAGCSEYVVTFDHTGDQPEGDEPWQRMNGGPEAGCGQIGLPGEPAIDGLPPDSATIPAG